MLHTKLKVLYSLILSIFLGCFLYSDEKVSILDLEVRKDSLFYKKGSDTPFSGTSIKYYENSSIGELETYKNGKWHGTHLGYHANGKISYKAIWENGRLLSSKTWSENRNLVESVFFPNGPNDLNSTIKLMEELVDINYQNIENGHVDITQTLHKLASYYFEQGKVNLAIETSKRGVDNIIKGYGTHHEFYAFALSHLASVQSDNEAILNIKKALNILSKTDNEDSLYTLNRELARRYISAGQIDKAIHLYHRLLSETKDNDLLSAEIYEQLELCYLRQSDWDKAFLCTEKTILLNKKLGKSESQYVEIYLKSAERFEKSGFLTGEFRQLQKALEIKEAHNQFDDSITAEIHNSIGLNLLERGDYHRAIVFFVSAKKIWVKLKGITSEEVAYTKEGYSKCLIALDKHEEALLLAFEYRDRLVEIYGEYHPKTFRAYCNLAEIWGILNKPKLAVLNWINASKCILLDGFLNYNDDKEIAKVYSNIMREHIKARQDTSLPWPLEWFSQKLIEATKGQYGNNHIVTGNVLGSLGDINLLLNDPKKTIDYGNEAISIFKKYYPDGTPTISDTYKNLAVANLMLSEPKNALLNSIKKNENDKELVLNVFKFLNHKERLQFSKQFSPFNFFASLSAEEELAEAVLDWKGIVLDSIIQENIDLRNWEKMLENPQFKDRFLNMNEDDFNAELAKHSAPLSLFNLNINELSKLLDEDTILAEIIKFDKLDKGDFLVGFESYGLILYQKDQNSSKLEKKWIELGAAIEVEKEIQKLRGTTLNSNGNFLKTLKSVSSYILGRLESEIPPQIKNIIFCPDGELNFVPYHALLTNDGKFLSEKYGIFYISAGRDLVFENLPSAPKNITIFANPEFDKVNSDSNEKRNSINSDSLAFRNLGFSKLPGAEIEGKMLLELAEEKGFQSNFKLSSEASEKNLRQIDSPLILHLATHGFFLSQKNLENISKSMSMPYANQPRSTSFNPMQRSGLALAGAKHTIEKWQKGEAVDEKNDGILTAEEASELDLSKTWLTVLSACDTGSGIARAGEGVLGLRRAFAMAGTQNLLLTLWPVSDSFTKDFMVSFYKEALDSGNAPKAMAKVQREWLVKLREERSISQAVKLAGPFVLTFRGNPELN